MDTKEILDNVNKFNEGLEALRAEVKSVKDKTDPLSVEKQEKIKAYLDGEEQRAKDLKSAYDKADAAETKALELEERLTSLNPSEAKNETEVAEMKAYEGYLRNGTMPTDAEIKRISNADASPGGGYVVPDGQYNMILEQIQDMNEIRKFAMVLPASSSFLKVPVQLGRTSVTEVAEGAVRTESTNPTLAERVLDFETLTSEVYLTRETLADAFINWNQFLVRQWVDDFAAQESSNFLTKNESGNRGIFNSQTGTTVPTANIITTSGTGRGKVTIPQMFDLVFKRLHSKYSKKGTFLLHKSTLGDIMSLNDEGNYLFASGRDRQGMLMNNIMGHAYGICDDMDAIPTGATGAALNGKNLLVFADLSRFLIGDRQQIEVIRDDYTQSSRNSVRFVANCRVASQISHPEAFAIVRSGTS